MICIITCDLCYKSHVIFPDVTEKKKSSKVYRSVCLLKDKTNTCCGGVFFYLTIHRLQGISLLENEWQGLVN